MDDIDKNVSRFSLMTAVPEQAFRTAPHNVEAEQALLGAIMVNNDAYDRVSDFLQPGHFSEDLHRRIYEIMSQLIRAAPSAPGKVRETWWER